MNQPKFPARHQWMLALLLLVGLAAACAPVRQGVSWADLTTVDSGQQQNILVSYNDYMVMVDPANGRPIPLRNPEGEIRTDDQGNPRRWEVAGKDTSSQFFTTPIWLDDETLLVADYNSKLVKVNTSRADVQPGSQFEVDGRAIVDPILFEDLVLLAFAEGDVAAYSIETFAQIWRFDTTRGIWGDPVLVDETLYVATMDHHFYALSANTGEKIWELDLNGAMASGPLYADGHFYIGTFGHRIFDISAAGEILAEYQTSDWVWSTPVLVDHTLYATDLGGYVYALDASQGLTEIWKTRASSKGIRPRPLITEQYVIVADREGTVYWLNRADGVVIEDYTQEVGGEILSDIILVQRAEPLEPLVVVSTTKRDKVLVAFTLDAVPNWTYGR